MLKFYTVLKHPTIHFRILEHRMYGALHGRCIFTAPKRYVINRYEYGDLIHVPKLKIGN